MTALPPGAAPQPQGLPIGPVPTQLTIGQAPGPDGRPLIVLQVTTPVGLACYFLDADCAATIGEHLARFGQAARAGLVLPGNGDTPG